MTSGAPSAVDTPPRNGQAAAATGGMAEHGHGGQSAQAPPTGPLGSLLRPDALAVWSWVLGYTAVLTSLSILRYQLWLATGLDLGLFEQDLWLVLHRGLTAVSTLTGHPFLADAASYVLVPLAPLYAAGGVGALLLLQSFCFGLGYWFIRRIAADLAVDGRTAHLIGVIYLVYPTVLGTNLFDFHPDAVGVPLLFGAAWMVVRRRPVAYAAFTLAALLVKDTVPVVLAGLGVTLLILRRPAWAAATLVAGVLVAYVDVHLVIPGLMHGAVMLQWSGLYRWLGPTPASGLRQLLLHPADLLAWVGRPRSWEYLAWLFGPLLAPAVAGRRGVLNGWWLPALALIEANLLSPAPVMSDPFNELSALAVPFLFVATVAAVGRGRLRPPAVRIRWWPVLPTAFLAVFIWQQHRTTWRHVPAQPQALQAAAARLPAAAPAVVPNVVAPHVADRARLWLVGWPLGPLPAGTYVLLAPGVSASGVGSTAALAALTRAVSAPHAARRLFAQSGVTLYRLLRPLELHATTHH